MALAPAFFDRVGENTSSSGTADFSLAGALGGAQTFSTKYADGQLVEYSAFAGGQWETGLGTYVVSGNKITRPTVALDNSSNTTAKISFTASPIVIASAPAALISLISGANLLIDGDFRINQRGYVSGATLAAGAYGHDRWKAGSSGGDYSFTQLASPTTITIAANKSVIQVVENKNVVGGSYTLSWTGTATARVGVNTATPSGNFAASPITVTGQTAGTTMSVEFTGANAAGGSSLATNTGTLGTVKLGTGSIPTPFVPDDYAEAWLKCQRYFQKYTTTGQAYLIMGSVYATTTLLLCPFTLRSAMRGTPTLTTGGTISGFVAGTVVNSSTVTIGNDDDQFSLAYLSVQSGTSFGTAGQSGPLLLNSAGAFVAFDAEL